MIFVTHFSFYIASSPDTDDIATYNLQKTIISNFAAF